MTLRDLLDYTTIEGYHKIQCWEDCDGPIIYQEGYDFPPRVLRKYGNRKVRYIFPFMLNDCEPAITIELEEED